MAIIANLFGAHRPFRELQAHMRIVNDCASHVPALIDALIANDPEGLKNEAKVIFALEAQADSLKHTCRLHLPKRLFLPVDRRDLLEGLLYQDIIADRAEDIAGILLQREMPAPEEMKQGLADLTHKCVEVVDLAKDVVELFDELLEVGFRGKLVDKVEEKVNAINVAEDQADRLEREVSRVLFSLEDRLDPLSVIFWYRILEWIGDLADYAEKVGNNFRLIIAR